LPQLKINKTEFKVSILKASSLILDSKSFEVKIAGAKIKLNPGQANDTGMLREVMTRRLQHSQIPLSRGVARRDGECMGSTKAPALPLPQKISGNRDRSWFTALLMAKTKLSTLRNAFLTGLLLLAPLVALRWLARLAVALAKLPRPTRT
jgi:hypothetical protein